MGRTFPNNTTKIMGTFLNLNLNLNIYSSLSRTPQVGGTRRRVAAAMTVVSGKRRYWVLC